MFSYAVHAYTEVDTESETVCILLLLLLLEYYTRSSILSSENRVIGTRVASLLTANAFGVPLVCGVDTRSSVLSPENRVIGARVASLLTANSFGIPLVCGVDASGGGLHG